MSSRTPRRSHSDHILPLTSLDYLGAEGLHGVSQRVASDRSLRCFARLASTRTIPNAIGVKRCLGQPSLAFRNDPGAHM